MRAGLKVGDSFELTRVASATSAADGTYSLDLDYAALDRVASENETARRANLKAGIRGTRETPRDGEQNVNLEIKVSSADGSLARDYSATVSYVPGSASARVATLAPAPGTDVPTLAEARSAASRGGGSTPPLDFSLDTSTGLVASDKAPSAAAKIPSSCQLISNYGPRTVYTGQTSATVTGGYSQRWSQTIGSTSHVSQGISVSGAYGSWSKGSTTSIDSTSETTWPASSSSGSRLMTTQYTFGKYYCSYAGTVAKYSYVIYPQGHYGGASTVATTAPSATYCATYSAGAGFSKTTSNAVTYSDGVKLTNLIGVDLSARTGFTTSAKYSVTFSSTRKLCGVSGGPGTSAAYQLVVKP